MLLLQIAVFCLSLTRVVPRPGGCPGCAETVEVDSTVQSLANFAVNHVDFPVVFSQGCDGDIVARVLSVSRQVVAGTIYTLDLEVMTGLGGECDLVHTRVCRGIKVFKPLPFACPAASPSLCAELSNAPDVACTEGEIESPIDCICTEEYAPVCGVDGRTYSNGCQAGCAGVEVEQIGECGSKPGCICTEEYAPVCGVDGRTYSNSCKAGCAGVEVEQIGECGSRTGGCPGCALTVEVDSTVQSLANFAVNHVDFPAVFNQGCEEDITASVLSVSSQVVAGIIYTLDLEVQTGLGEKCDLVHTRVCRGIKIFKPLPFQCQAASPSLCAELSNAPDVTCTEGEIESVGPIEHPVGCICPAHYEPVCGVDGETYSNTCEAGCVGVSVERPGECGPVPVPGADLCLAVFTPVCGQDGKTYSNNCQAAAAGVEVVSSGACVSEPIVFPGPGLGPGCICTFQFEPVCGEDGQTYSNSCQAGCEGVEVASQGECETAS